MYSNLQHFYQTKKCYFESLFQNIALYSHISWNFSPLNFTYITVLNVLNIVWYSKHYCFSVYTVFFIAQCEDLILFVSLIAKTFRFIIPILRFNLTIVVRTYTIFSSPSYFRFHFILVYTENNKIDNNCFIVVTNIL